jgi:transposase
MAETWRRFDQDFRELRSGWVRETGRPISEIARDLAVNAGTSANWVNADRCRRGDGTELGEDEWRSRPGYVGRMPSWRWSVFKRSVALWVKDAMGR